MTSSKPSKASGTVSARDRRTGRASGLNQVALKIAAVAFGTALAGGILASAWTASWTWSGLLWVPLLVGIGTYAACVRMLTRRLEMARNLLRQIRKSRFEDLDRVPLPRGDEINALVWQIFRTGQVLQREMTELRRMENYRREFIGNVSHELKTPIFAIRGFAETLEGGALSDPRVNQSFLKKILRNADRLDHLVADLGEIARIEQGELTMKPAPFDVGRLAREVVESLEPLASSRDVDLKTNIQSNLPAAIGDQEHLRQVVINLVENAIKYNREGGTVELGARLLSNGEVGITVVDNGIGIPKELIPRITERFFRVDKSRSRAQGGTGLGLAIVKHILAAHERTLQVESREGAGSTFGFSLPGTSAPLPGSPPAAHAGAPR